MSSLNLIHATIIRYESGSYVFAHSFASRLSNFVSKLFYFSHSETDYLRFYRSWIGLFASWETMFSTFLLSIISLINQFSSCHAVLQEFFFKSPKAIILNIVNIVKIKIMIGILFSSVKKIHYITLTKHNSFVVIYRQ